MLSHHLLLVFDVGQTLCNTNEEYETFLAKQSKAIYHVFIEVLAKVPETQIKEMGFDYLVIQGILKEPQKFENPFCNQMTFKVKNYRIIKNNSNCGKELMIEDQLAEILTEDQVFNALTKAQILSQKMKDSIGSLTKAVLDDDRSDVAEYLPLPGAHEMLKQLKQMGYKIALCTNANFAKRQRKIIKNCGLEEYSDMTVISADYGIRKPNPEMINVIKKAFPQYHDYEIVIIGDMLNRDILCGSNANIRTIWFTQELFSPETNYKELLKGQIKADFWFVDYRQIYGILVLVENDAKFISSLPESQKYKTPEIYPSLPSQSCLKIGYYFSKLAEDELYPKGIGISNSKLLWYPIQIECEDFLCQGPFDMFLQKATDLLVEQEIYKKNQKYQKLKEYCLKSGTIVVDPFGNEMFTLSRVALNHELQRFIKSDETSKIAKTYQISLKVPKCCILEPKSGLQEIVEKSGLLHYPIIIKSDEAIESKEARTITIVMRKEALEKALEYYKNKRVILQEFVYHGGNLHKSYILGKAFSYLLKKSLSSLLAVKDCYTFNSQQQFPKEMIEENADTAKTKVMDQDFLKAISFAFSKHSSLSLFGLDFILNQNDPKECYIIDVNYFPSFRGFENCEEFITNHLIEVNKKKK